MPQQLLAVVGRLTHSLPLTRPAACPSVSLAFPPLRSAKRYVFSANGALLKSAWGNAPGVMG